MTTKIFSAPIIAKTKNYIQTAYTAYINKKWYVSKSECSTESTPSFGILDKISHIHIYVSLMMSIL